ncbi:MAG: OmpA family protein [Terriglobales bacterium]|jgi:chemotaxis protein MotB
MSRRRKRVRHVNPDRWLVSYADFITLLFAFFVVLYASSQVDKRKVGKLALAIQVAFQEMGVFPASTTKVPMNMADPMPFSTVQAVESVERTGSVGRVSSHPGGTLGTGAENGDLAQLESELENTLEAEIKSKAIAMRRVPDGLVISLREAGFFESGSAQMKSTSQATFDHLAGLLRKRDCRVRIEGHTDNVPIHNAQFSSNWELSAARATEIVRLLIVRNGYNPDRLSAAGFAEYHPVASNGSAEGRALNRRVDLVILREEAPEQSAAVASAPAEVGRSAKAGGAGAQSATSQAAAPRIATPPATKPQGAAPPVTGPKLPITPTDVRLTKPSPAHQ